MEGTVEEDESKEVVKLGTGRRKARATRPKADHSPGSPISHQGLMGSWPHSPKMHHVGGTLPWTFPHLTRARP